MTTQAKKCYKNSRPNETTKRTQIMLHTDIKVKKRKSVALAGKKHKNTKSLCMRKSPSVKTVHFP